MDSSETSYLLTPHIVSLPTDAPFVRTEILTRIGPSQPFPLDYHQTLLSLLDILSEVYSKISKILGPSPFPHASQHMLGPLGLLSPHPGVSYLFTGTDAAPVGDGDGLWGIAHGGGGPGPGIAAAAGGGGGPPGAGSGFFAGMNMGPGGAPGMGMGMSSAGVGGGLSSPPPSWTPALGEIVLKVDAKFKVRSVLCSAMQGRLFKWACVAISFSSCRKLYRRC